MKIITKTKREGVLCFIQVKDILFLANITKNKKLMEQYLNLINDGKTDDEFIKIIQESFISIIDKCDYIIDFTDFNSKDASLNYLSRLIINMNYNIPSDDVKRECLDHKTEGIRDIIDFKRGGLEYKIPLVPDGALECLSSDGRLSLESTVLPDTFIIKAIDDSDVQNNDYYDFYLESLDKIFSLLYPEVDENDKKVTCFDRGKMLVINISRCTKKKENKLNKLLAKIKKES